MNKKTKVVIIIGAIAGAIAVIAWFLRLFLPRVNTRDFYLPKVGRDFYIPRGDRK